MHSVHQITKDTFWVGASDRRLERFENLFTLPQGVSYNAYMIFDEKIALLDTVDLSVVEQFLANVDFLLKGRTIDYLILTHIEPDHGGGIAEIVQRFPNIQLVATKKAHQLYDQFFPLAPKVNFIEVDEASDFSLGTHQLRFYTAPMVHWPEVMFVLDERTGALFSADAFGTFGALSGHIFADQADFEQQYLDEARRYYANIIGKFGLPVQAVLKKLPVDKIKFLCPLHGPVWRDNLAFYMNKYDLWSRYEPEESGVLILYASMYGHTASLAEALAGKLSAKGAPAIRMYDVSKTNPSVCIAELWRYSHLVLASPTYNLGIHYSMDAFLHELGAINAQNRKVAIIANHSWASAALRLMTEKVSAIKNMEIISEGIDVKSNTGHLFDDHLDKMADDILLSMKK